MRCLLLLLAAFVLLGASPAWAKAPPSNPVFVFVGLQTKKEKPDTHSCAKGGPQKQVKLPGSRAFADLMHKAVVACEQPPRSQPLLHGLKHAESVLVALVG